MSLRLNKPDASSPVSEGGLVCRPEPARWREWLEQRGRSARQLTMRSELGLAVDRPVVMSGHQSEFWHPGILAKWFAVQAAGERNGAESAWVEVDSDVNAGWSMAYPAAGPKRATWDMGLKDGRPVDETPTGSLSPIAVRAEDVERLGPAPGYGFAVDGLRAMAAALERHGGATNLAEQVAGARGELLEWCGPVPKILFSSRLARLSLFAEAVHTMRSDPAGCAAAFNRAAAKHPRAGVRPLAMAEGRVELPLWSLADGQPRKRVFAHELESLDPRWLAPRALLLTGLLRAGACDLFIHGLGGEKYDFVTEAWLGEWLGWTLAPTAVVSATLYLPFEAMDVPSPERIARARWEAWHARNDPAMLGDGAAAARKRELIEAIKGEPDRRRRAAIFREMRGVTEEARRGAEGEIGELGALAAALMQRGALAGVVFDRTWGFPLYPRESLEDLQRLVRRAV